MDRVIIKNLQVRNIIGTERWEREKEQTVVINLWMELGSPLSGADDLMSSYNYGTISKSVMEFAEKQRFKCVEALACGIAQHCILSHGVAKLTVRVEKPTALLYAKSAGIEIVRERADFLSQSQHSQHSQPSSSSLSPSSSSLHPVATSPSASSSIFHESSSGTAASAAELRETITEVKQQPRQQDPSSPSLHLQPLQRDFSLEMDASSLRKPEDKIFVSDVLVRTIIGVNPWEREEKQNVLVNLALWALETEAPPSSSAPWTGQVGFPSLGASSSAPVPSFSYRSICSAVVTYVEATSFRTVEALAIAVARLCLTESSGVRQVTVRIEKPSALIFADSAGVEVTRKLTDFADLR